MNILKQPRMSSLFICTACQTVTIIQNSVIYGVNEIASLENFTDHKTRFIEQISKSIGTSVSTLKSTIKTTELLKIKARQAEEMNSQEEEMRQNMEELRATQEQLQQREQELKNEIVELKKQIREQERPD